MDPFIAKLIGRSTGRRVADEAPNSGPVLPVAQVLEFRTARADSVQRSKSAERRHSAGLNKAAGLAPGTVKYTVGSRVFILIAASLTDEQREVLTDDLLLSARTAYRGATEQRRNGGRS